MISVSLVVLAACLVYAYIGLQLPKKTFAWDLDTWTVTSSDPRCATTDPRRCLLEGDKILTIDGVRRAVWMSDRSAAIFIGDRHATLTVERDGEVLDLPFDWSQEPLVRTIEVLVSSSFSLLFWLLGTFTAVLVRPRDERWLVLLGFYYVTALFLAAGAVSLSNQAFSVTVAHVAAAFFMPLVVHLHLVLPRRDFPVLRRSLLPALWATAVSLAVVDVTIGYPSPVMALLFITGLGLSLLIFIVRLRQPSPPAVRAAQRLILTGLLLGLLPTIGVVWIIRSLEGLTPLPFDSNRLLLSSLAAVLLPNWPLSYLYAIHKLDLGKLELRANRALGGYGFWSIYITLYVALFLTAAAHWPAVYKQPIVFSLCLSLLFVGTTPYARKVFQRWIDRHVFGLRHTPEEVVDLFASRIPKALEGENLGRILERDILPTLLVRESALVFAKDEGRTLDPVHIFGVYRDHLPTRWTDIERLLIAAAEGRARIVPPGAIPPPLDWVRVVLPLAGRSHNLGAWLLGRRDPDDHYPRDDVRLLSNLANQIGSVLRVRRELAENRRLQDQLVQSQKMEAIGRLSAGVAHDFNNLLSAILGYSDLLLDRTTRQPLERRAYVQGIKEAGEKAAALTSQLLAFSRQQVMAARIVDLNQVVLDLESLLRRVLEEDIELAVDLAAEASTVRIDPGQMEQVLLNLVVNASDAMTDHGGVLTVSTLEFVCGGSSPCLNDMTPGPWVVLRVSDTGAGIPNHVVDRIFEPFFTTKKLGEGTGLGLSMVYGIINQSQGHITVDTEMGEGTTFSIFLPLAEAEDDELLDEESAVDIEARALWQNEVTETVLLAEDEPSVRRVVSEMLTAKGFEVLLAHDGAHALEVAAAHSGRIDLLLSDVMMPQLRGPELAEQLLLVRPELQVIFMSGYNEEKVLGERLSRGDAVLIRKPFKPRELIHQVRLCLDRRARVSQEDPSPVSSG